MNENNTNFFESVAHHNLERFHSETIAWILNNNPEIVSNFIKSILGKKEEVLISRAKAEISDIDILVFYQTSKGNFIMHIENKVKASEHSISVENKIKNKIKNQSILNKKLSQTEYYYLRNREEIESKIKFEFNIESNIQFEWDFVYLLPALSFEEKKYNIWTIANIKNPWKNICYFDLLNCIPNNKLNPILQEYKVFLSDNFTLNPKSELLKVDDNNRVVFNNSSLSNANINIILNKNATIFEEHGIKLHFIKLRDNLINYCKKEFSEYRFNIRFITDTGNNKSFLLDVSLERELLKPNNAIFEKDKVVELRIGLQFEKNSIKTAKFKYYIADVEYKSGLIIDKPEYKKNANKILKNIFYEKYLQDNSQLNKDGKLKFNGSKTKSFCSFSNDFEFDNLSTIENKFIVEIRHLVSSLEKKTIEEHIKVFE